MEEGYGGDEDEEGDDAQKTKNDRMNPCSSNLEFPSSDKINIFCSWHPSFFGPSRKWTFTIQYKYN